MQFKIFAQDGVAVVNTIEASASFMAANYLPAQYEQVILPPEPAAPPDSRLWWIDVGPFKDRLGADALAIAASTNDACKAVIEMLNGRQYVDLKGASAGNLINLLIGTNQPTANPLFAGSGPMTTAKKLALTNTPTTEFERHIKGLQP